MALEKILVVGKDSGTQKLLRPYSKQIFAADDPCDIRELIESVEPEAILFDARVLHEQVAGFLSNRRGRAMDTPVIVIGSSGNDEQADALMQAGAFGYIKGKRDMPRLGQLLDKIKNAANGTDSDRKKFFAEDCPSSVSIVGKSPATARSLKMIRLVAASTCNPVLIVGETGTGKELAARAVHILRHGTNSRFVALNCAGLTASLLESELFGHVKGSFTSADRDKRGLFELAEEGTIFLDEISEMPLELQAKMLRVIQEKTFRKVGGTVDIKCDATIVASSNQNLHKAVEKNRFRSDLYYRLSICPIVLAPLRISSRKDDILLLADYFIKNSTICPEKVGKIQGLTRLAQESLLKHHWPGNVRELRNVIERAVLLESSEKIGTGNLLVNPEQYMDISCESPIVAGMKDFSLERAEKELVKKALQEAGWQKTRAAAMLGITRATLYAKVKQYNLAQPQKQLVVATT